MYTSGYGMSGCGSSGIVVLNSNGDNGNGGDAIRMTNGSLAGAFVVGPPAYATAVVDGNGNPVAGAVIQSNSGLDSYTNTTSSDHLRTDLSVGNQTVQLRPGASGFSATASGNAFRSVSVDPVFGLMLSPGNAYGYTSSFGQSVAGAMDLYFASFMPPSSVSGTATTGGTLAAGSYWYAIRAALSTNCNAATQSAPAVFGPVAVSGSNNAVQLSWTQLQGISARRELLRAEVQRGAGKFVAGFDAEWADLDSWRFAELAGHRHDGHRQYQHRNHDKLAGGDASFHADVFGY